MTADHARVLALIAGRTTPAAAISREDLCRITGLPDRAVRRLISELVTEHDQRHIVAASRGGYYAADANGRAKYARREIGKAVHILERARRVAGPQVVAEHAGQIRLFLTASESAEATEHAPAVDPAVHGSTDAAALVLDEAGKPQRCWCGTYLRGKQGKYCSDFHRDVFHGRRKAAS